MPLQSPPWTPQLRSDPMKRRERAAAAPFERGARDRKAGVWALSAWRWRGSLMGHFWPICSPVSPCEINHTVPIWRNEGHSSRGGQYDDISRCLLMGPIHEMSNGGYTYDVQPPGFIIPQMFRDDGVLKIGFDHVKIEVKFSLLRRVFCWMVVWFDGRFSTGNLTQGSCLLVLVIIHCYYMVPVSSIFQRVINVINLIEVSFLPKWLFGSFSTLLADIKLQG